ncbi:MAG: amidohydrolase family protein [Proteobacteria bacterium]|nr:amidohydrolase family protein [Pseudomonadota bacterium]
MSPAELELIARQLFIEMLEAGYTSVAEFHYLHRREDGAAYGASDGVRARARADVSAGDGEDANPLHAAVIAAARATGIGLTFLPVLYQHSDFGAKPLREDQRRFYLGTAEFVELIRAQTRATHPAGLLRWGAAFHSLRAVGAEALAEVSAALREIDPGMPVHIHIAEQVLEVKACLAATGKRPVEWLLDRGVLTPHWCLVHATQTRREELRGIAASGASVCICTTTEANLGDGLFDTAFFLQAGGLACIGSDSEVCVDPAEELRWLEYQQRLKRRRRAVLAGGGRGASSRAGVGSERHVGERLWAHAARAGARALGQAVGELRIGARADWLVLDGDHPSLAGAPPERALDRLVFGGGRAAIRDVMVGGRVVVRDGRHALRESSRRDFGCWMKKSI